MGLLDLLLHPTETRAIVQYKVWRDPLNARDPNKESDSLKRCYFFLDLTSRSFSTVVQELSDELRDAVMLFYLVLRGLDTIEDDMTLPLDRKLPLLREFYTLLQQDGWNFHESGPNEKDALLLKEFDVVIKEFKKLKKQYQVVITDITKDMGHGMAHYSDETVIVTTLEEYDQYCHYVAGVVGEGLSRLFASSGLESKKYADLMSLSNSMGLFLQKTNITRDFREDIDDGRLFWPKDIWSKYAKDPKELTLPANREKALNCISEMTCNALEHATDVLFYLSGLRNQSVFNFCAIPQVMAIATMDLVFRNPQVFERNVKIRKGKACRLIMQATNLKEVADIFVEHARSIHAKNKPEDPNFLRISELCGRIEQWVADVFPAHMAASAAQEKAISQQRKADDNQVSVEEQKQIDKDVKTVIVIVIGFWLAMGALTLFLAWLLGARFDLAFKDFWGKVAKVQDAVGGASTTINKVVEEVVATSAGAEAKVTDKVEL
ncbi:isoprenoid synthase domain-containing protein [Protomyces lactucae-debilis]|uniref:Squalene synthase n=1 Tax=Protomyces lactucae-debilis TaxID=2754530 RepID=A0A1Y2FS96_PROLT|nr:isoprenoid synthase domain-containing protein [Protomyces lactucae-debilis]ORY86164.1 isoprenoid synthase domain-containing protein [Protomyces lactucae-debilis]